jgi:lipopolysaccharide exporter
MKKVLTLFGKANSYAFLAYAAQLGLAFATFLLLVRMLPEHAFGIWVLYTTLTTFAEMSRAGLIQNGLVKLYKDHPREQGSIIPSGWLVSMIFGLVLATMLILLTQPLSIWWEAPELLTLAWYYLPLSLFLGTTRYIECLLMAEHDFKGIFISKFLYAILPFLLVCSFFFAGIVPGLEMLAGLQVAGAIFSLSVISFQKFRYFRKSTSPRKSWMIKLARYGSYIMATNFSSMLFNKLDILVIGSMLNPIAVATYNVAGRITNFMEVPLSSVAQVMYPRITEKEAKKDREGVARLYENGIGTLIALMIPACGLVFFLANPIILLTAGPGYLSAAPILQVLVLAVAMKPWGRLFGITLDAIGLPRLNFLFLLATLIFNLSLMLTLVPVWGNKGIAWATFISVTTNMLFGQWIIRHHLNISYKNITRETIQFYTKILKNN